MASRSLYVVGAPNMAHRASETAASALGAESWQSLIAMAPDLILVIAPDGTIRYINRVVEGYQLDEVLGSSVYQYISPQDGEAYAARLKHVLATGEFATFESAVENPDGSVTWHNSRLGPFKENGQIVGVTCISTDITERRELEQEVLEIAAREQRRIGQNLHDVTGQLLTGLRYLAKSLVAELQEVDSPHCKIAERINDGLRRAVKQVRRVAKGSIPLQVDRDALMLALANLANNTCELYGVRCTFDCDDQVIIEDSDTATHLYHIAQEAVTNAIKHGDSKDISISLTDDHAVTTLMILDNGSGITEQTGSGMGLKIMRYRAGLINWTLGICQGSSGGTEVACTLSKAE